MITYLLMGKGLVKYFNMIDNLSYFGPETYQNTRYIIQGGIITNWQKWKLSNKSTHLAIGPVDGFTEAFTSKHSTISLGPLTMTYEMAAVVLLEQLYRASEIERGSAYHRD